MQARDEEDGRGLFQLEALEGGSHDESPDVAGLVRQAARASRGLSRRARRHLRRALQCHLVDTGASAAEARDVLEGESPFLGEGEEEAFADDESFADDECPCLAGEGEEPPGFEFDTPPALEPATTIDALAAEPEFPPAVRQRLSPVLDAAAARQAVAWNATQHPQVSEIPLTALCARLEKYVDRATVEAALGAKVDVATLTAQLTLQFQRKCFRESGFHTGRLDEATLDALGFVRHRGARLNRADRGNSAAAAVLKRALTRDLTAPFGPDLTARTWFSFMLDAPFLGLTTRGGTGIHLVLMRKLRQAQSHLWTIPRYRGLSPVELGDALLWDAIDDPVPHGTTWTAPPDPDAKLGDRHRGARPGQGGASMHLPGLAVDLGYRANPWVGSLSFKEVSGRAATLVGGTVLRANGGRVRAGRSFGELADAPGLGRKALHLLAQGTLTTGQIYDALAQWNAWLERYLEMGTSDAALTAAIQARQADGTPGVMQGAGLARTVAFWRRQIRTDLESLRKNSFSAAGTPRDPRKGFLSFHRDLVIALRDKACLAWGAVDLGAGEKGSGDVMHFDCRVDGIGRAFVVKGGVANVPKVHPCLPPPQAPPKPQREDEYGPGEHEYGPQFEDEKPMKIGALKPADLKGTPFRLASKKGGEETVVFVSDAAMNAVQPTVLVYMHGLVWDKDGKLICGAGATISEYLLNWRFPLMQRVGASGKPIVLVVPTMKWGQPKIWGQLATPKGMNAFLDEVRSFLLTIRTPPSLTTKWPEKLEFAQVILAGHSKAYEVFNRLAGLAEDPDSVAGILGQLRHVWSLDTTYGGDGSPAAKWAVWALLRKNVKFKVLYYLKTGTAAEAEWMDRKAKALKATNVTVQPFPRIEGRKAVPARGSKPAQPEQKEDSHCVMILNHFHELLATL